MLLATLAGGEAAGLSDPDGVKSLVAFPAKHLQILKRVIVFAEVFVMRVAWLIRLAKLTAMVGAFPCKRLHLARPAASIRNH